MFVAFFQFSNLHTSPPWLLQPGQVSMFAHRGVLSTGCALYPSKALRARDCARAFVETQGLRRFLLELVFSELSPFQVSSPSAPKARKRVGAWFDFREAFGRSVMTCSSTTSRVCLLARTPKSQRPRQVRHAHTSPFSFPG